MSPLDAWKGAANMYDQTAGQTYQADTGSAYHVSAANPKGGDWQHTPQTVGM